MSAPGVPGNAATAAPGGELPIASAITCKARLRARELSFISSVPPRSGRTGVESVEAFATATLAAPAMKPTDPQDVPLPSRFPAVIVGAGAHSGAVVDALAGSGWEIVGATDESMVPGTEITPGIKVLGNDSLLPKLFADGVRVAFIGVGGATSNRLRRKIFEHLRGSGFFLPPIVHRGAIISQGSTLGEAACVMPGAVVGPRTRVGANALINAGSVIAHDAVIGDHAHLAPGTVLGGNVVIGAETTIGMGACVLLGIRIGRNVLVHMNASVAGDIGDNLRFTKDGQRLPRN